MVNPGRRTGEVAQIACALVLDDLLGSDSDRSRRVDERFGQLARSGLFHLVGCVWIGIGVGAGRGRWRGSGGRCDRSGACFLGRRRCGLLLRLLGFDAERAAAAPGSWFLVPGLRGRTGGGKARGREAGSWSMHPSGRGRRMPACRPDCAEIQELEPNSFIPPSRARRAKPEVEMDARGWLGVTWLP